ncbi:hypothetical protein [Mesorhizobium sp. LjNodule214]|uniref:hypothetical protein n=1 Tax=Mesorhizobium sp. LjNodule214 TaxID=3342252 RepID=UPI003F50D3A6
MRAILREVGIKLGTPSRAAFALVEPLLVILATMLREFGRLTKQVLIGMASRRLVADAMPKRTSMAGSDRTRR